MKKYLMILPFLITIICAISYNVIGCRVPADGTLDEPFFLVPIGWLFFFIGIIMVLTQFIIYLKRNFFNKIS